MIPFTVTDQMIIVETVTVYSSILWLYELVL